MDFPYDPQELVVFSLIGVVCGLGKVGFIESHNSRAKIDFFSEFLKGQYRETFCHG
jgi:hypothetical protein